MFAFLESPSAPAKPFRGQRDLRAFRLGHRDYRSTAKSFHSPGTPLSSATPRSRKAMPDPATRSLTVLETRTSLALAAAATRAPMWTARPPTLPSMSTSRLVPPALALSALGVYFRRAG